MGCSPPVSSVHNISQARILEWVAIFFSRGFSQLKDQTLISCIGRWILCHRTTLTLHTVVSHSYKGFPGGSVGKESACRVGDLGRSLGWEDLEKGMTTHSNILAWRIPMDREAWWATVHGVAKIWTWLSN